MKTETETLKPAHGLSPENLARLDKAGFTVILKSELTAIQEESDTARKEVARYQLTPLAGNHALGDTVEQDGVKLRRVKVISGRGNFAYWYKNLPKGEEAGWYVVVDMLDNPMASHRAGRLYEAHEGKPGMDTWLVVGS
jgi:hypothetical protein